MIAKKYVLSGVPPSGLLFDSGTQAAPWQFSIETSACFSSSDGNASLQVLIQGTLVQNAPAF
jgi:hypothetical protein